MRTWMPCVLCFSLLLTGFCSAAWGQTTQQKQNFILEQQRAEAARKQQQDRDRQQKNDQYNRALQDELSRRANPSAGKARPFSIPESANPNAGESEPLRIPELREVGPAAIQADKQLDPQKTGNYLIAWAKAYDAVCDPALALSLQAMEFNDWKSAFAYDAICRGGDLIKGEMMLMIVAERLAACATTPKEKVRAAAILLQRYDDFYESRAERAYKRWRVAISDVRNQEPEFAALLERVLIDGTEKLNSEFMQPRAKYWKSQSSPSTESSAKQVRSSPPAPPK